MLPAVLLQHDVDYSDIAKDSRCLLVLCLLVGGALVAPRGEASSPPTPTNAAILKRGKSKGRLV
jgi:hypothetical protein